MISTQTGIRFSVWLMMRTSNVVFSLGLLYDDTVPCLGRANRSPGSGLGRRVLCFAVKDSSVSFCA